MTSKSLCGSTETDTHFLNAGHRLFFHQVVQEKGVRPLSGQGYRRKELFILKTGYATAGKTAGAVAQFIAQRV